MRPPKQNVCLSSLDSVTKLWILNGEIYLFFFYKDILENFLLKPNMAIHLHLNKIIANC